MLLRQTFTTGLFCTCRWQAGKRPEDQGVLSRLWTIQGRHAGTRQNMSGKTCRDKTEHVLPSLLVFGSHSLAAAMMPSQHFLIQRNLANYLLVAFITHFLNIVFTRLRVICRRDENGQVMNKKRCWWLGKTLFFNEKEYSWGRMRI